VEPLEELYKLYSFLNQQGIALESAQREKLEHYYHALLSFSLKHSIISKNDQNYIISKHFTGSFHFIKILMNNPPQNILDLGSGAGFPGVLLSLFFKKARVTMIDSVRKKTVFLSRVIKELDLNATVINDRIENFLLYNERPFDIITARALASVDDLVEMSRSLLKNAELHTVKGPDYQKEIKKYDSLCKIKEFPISKEWSSFSEFLDNKIHISLTI